MKTKINFAIIIALTIINSLSAQFELKGTITDSEDNKSLPDASIYIPEINRGTTADINGNYSIKNIPNGKYNVEYSYIGHKKVVIKITGQNKVEHQNVTLGLDGTACLHQIVITAGAYSTQDETAIKIETINKKDLEGFGGISLIKDLARIPGIDAVSKGTGIATPIIRGLSTNNILVLNNGVKMQNFQFSVNHPYIIDEFGVEKIEVVKGPASLLFGSNAVGGALNMIKEGPALKNQLRSDINFNYNSNTKGYVSNVGLKVSPGDLFFGLRAGIKNHKDYIDGNNRIVPNSRFNEKSAKVFAGISKNSFVSKLYIDYNLMELGLTVPPSIKLFTKNSRLLNNWYQNLSNILISSKNIIYTGNYRNEITINYQTNNRKLFEDPNGNEDFNTVNMLLNTLTYEAKTTKQFGNHSFVLAIQGLNQTNENIDAPEHVLPDFSLNDLAGMGLLKLNYNKKLHIQFGVRYDTRAIDIPKQEHLEKRIKKSYQNISYSAGLTMNLMKHLLIRTNIASGYRTPSIAELTQDGGHGARYEIGNTNLNPQRNYEGDISMHFHSHQTRIEVSGFYNKINNYIFLSPTTDISENGLPIFKYLQTPAKLYGFEANLGYFPTSWLNFSVAYNYLIAKKDNGKYLPLIPQNKLRGNVSFSKDLKYKHFKEFAFDIENLYAFEQNKYHLTETFTPAYNTINISLAQSLNIKNQQIKVNVKVNNVLDAKYIDHLSTLKPLGYYDIGRNINIGIKIILNSRIK